MLLVILCQNIPFLTLNEILGTFNNFWLLKVYFVSNANNNLKYYHILFPLQELGHKESLNLKEVIIYI